VLITFDDGYRDNYTEACPILREFGAAATLFLCTGPITSGSLLWWDRVDRSARRIRDAGGTSVDLGTRAPAAASDLLRKYLGRRDGAASRALGDLIDLLKELPDADRESCINALEHQSPPDTPRDLMLSWGEVRAMRDSGISLGAHSVTHPALSDLAADAVHAEVRESKLSIEEHVGEGVTAFAYPYGKASHSDEFTVEALREAGFLWAYTTENGVNVPAADPYTLRRNGMRSVPHYVLAARLAGVFEHPALVWLRRRIEGRSPVPARHAGRTEHAQPAVDYESTAPEDGRPE
jgi:peptidoglycan/xylan/chitin deacetylase (PgdA/CDA1 family)